MAFMRPGTTANWTISDTAHRSLSFATGIIAAATSDDIDPVSLLTCSTLGAMLPVSIETRVKVEQLARRGTTSHVLTYLKAQMGYRRNDSIELMSRSDSGVRFLCFAATLNSLNRYDAADRLDSLLEITETEDQVRPTIRQLQVMLSSLESKLAMSDYDNSVVGFEIMLRCKLNGGGHNDFAVNVPPRNSFRDLVIALSDIDRSRVTKLKALEIRLHSSYMPWTCAFVKWMLGSAPQVRTSAGLIILDGNNSPITLTVTNAIRGQRRKASGSKSQKPKPREICQTLQTTAQNIYSKQASDFLSDPMIHFPTTTTREQLCFMELEKLHFGAIMLQTACWLMMYYQSAYYFAKIIMMSVRLLLFRKQTTRLDAAQLMNADTRAWR